MDRKIKLLAALGLALVIVLAYPAPPSSSMVVEAPPAPSDRELRLVAELTSWVLGDAGAAGFELVEDVPASIRHRQESFELFRTYNAPGARRALIQELPYGDLLYRTAREVGIDSLLLASLVKAESSFDATVVSSKGAQGLMQLMPATARSYGAVDALDPQANVRAGARYLKALLEQYDGDLELAVAAYNAGPGNVRRYGGVPPFPETVRYVDRVLATYVELHRSLWQQTRVSGLIEQAGSEPARVVAR